MTDGICTLLHRTPISNRRRQKVHMSGFVGFPSTPQNGSSGCVPAPLVQGLRLATALEKLECTRLGLPNQGGVNECYGDVSPIEGKGLTWTLPTMEKHDSLVVRTYEQTALV